MAGFNVTSSSTVALFDISTGPADLQLQVVVYTQLPLGQSSYDYNFVMFCPAGSPDHAMRLSVAPPSKERGQSIGKVDSSLAPSKCGVFRESVHVPGKLFPKLQGAHPIVPWSSQSHLFPIETY
jgi:hypothetical protein